MDVTKDLDKYLRHHRAEGSSPKTLEYHRDSIGLLARFLAAQDHSLALEDLTADDVRAWIEDQRGRGLAQKSIATRVRSVKAFTRWLVDEEWLDRDPLRKVKVPKVDVTAKPTLSPDEVDTLLRACDRKTATGARDFAMMLLLFSTGLRASELLSLRVEDVDWNQGLILVRRGKGGKFRTVPLGAKVDKALDRYLEHPARRDQAQDYVFLTRDGEQLAYEGLKMVFRRYEDKTGIHCNPHKFRHSAAIAYLRGGGRVESLKSLLGHATLDQSLHYARLCGIDLTAAHLTADPARGLKTRV